ncbi:ribosome assembly factor SBDS [Candidatus Woesearchaeota archaeon]|nr:ribosome assembly factor SBDS [Candidatus Woesearchaeota archaeon]
MISKGRSPVTYDHERIRHLNVARLDKGGNRFEVPIDPDKAIAYKHQKSGNLNEVLHQKKVFTDAKKGMLASETALKSLFGTADPLKVAEIILKEGEIQLTTEHRDKIREEKRKRILSLIQRNAIDPKTKLPHPLTRIENAFEQARCHIDEFKTAEEQLDGVIRKLRPILPIKIEQLRMNVHVPAVCASQCFDLLKKLGDLSGESWGSDGSLMAKLQIPAGLREEVIDKLNKATKGSVEISKVEEIQ